MSLTLDFSKGTVQIAELPERMRQAAKEVILRTLEEMRTIAYALCQKDTGALANSIRIVGDSKLVAGGGGFINPKTRRPVNYGPYVEGRYPFMMPSYYAVRLSMLEEIEQNILEKCQK